MAAASLISISFPGKSATEASRAAADLTNQINKGLLEEGLPAIAQQRRTDPDAQDIGQVVQLTLAAPAIVVLARGVALGIQKYMSRTNRAAIRIQRSDGTAVEISDIESRDVGKIITAMNADVAR